MVVVVVVVVGLLLMYELEHLKKSRCLEILPRNLCELICA